MTLFKRMAETSQEAAQQGNARPAEGPFGSRMILLIYGALLLYFLYTIFKGYRARGKISQDRAVFSRKPRKLIYIVSGMIAVIGAYNIVLKEYFIGAVMAALGFVFLYSSMEKVVVAANGIYGDSKFYNWDIVRKWAWDKRSGDLILLVKERGKQDQNAIIRVGTENMVAVNDAIRKYKLNKGPAR
uniref:DUF5673 domain-containing protein n=1 Tax=Ndongobacter massiliensis TaxID=1871025 RepID=UPI000930DC00|nr:DUF5673 domain-containing protein [Ndongobacter massiliensis]